MRHAAKVLILWLILLAGCGAVANQMAPGAPNAAVPESSPSPVAQPTGDPQRGAAIFVGDVTIAGFVACRGCHSVDPAAGDGIGPNLAGIALRAGSRMPGVPADDYIRRSILVHDDYVVPGFEAGLARGVVGRDFAEILSTQDVADLTAYLLTLDQASVAQAPTMPPSSPTPSPAQPLPAASGAVTPSPTLSAPIEPSPGELSPTLPTSPSPDNRTATAPDPANAPSTPQGTPEPATASPTAVTPTIPPSPTVATPPTAAMAPTQPPPPATAPVANQDEPLPEELRVFTGCMTCHDQHAQSIVRMPHVRFPRCSACHSGSPSRVGCPTCHSMHRIQAPHGGENPNLPCSHCHADR